VLVQWSTAEEINVSRFEVERSFDGLKWTRIADVKATGNSNVLNNYSYTDQNVTSQVIYYRIREVDSDGKFSYTSIRTIKTEKNSAIMIAGVQNNILLQFATGIRGKVNMQLISLSGQLLDQQVISNPIGQVVVPSRIRGNCIVVLSNDLSLYVTRQILL
jgi:hypothetical protein